MKIYCVILFVLTNMGWSPIKSNSPRQTCLEIFGVAVFQKDQCAIVRIPLKRTLRPTSKILVQVFYLEIGVRVRLINLPLAAKHA